MERTKKARPVYDIDLMDSAVAGITHRKKQQRSSRYAFVKKQSIDFTAEMWDIIEAHRKQPGVCDNLRETIYQGLILLAQEENL